MIPLVAAIVWLGVYPAPVLRRMEGAATKFVNMVDARRNLLTTSVAEAER
jgi:NADH:ubiquinone oxidoreductase subunit 4 (subunit M)